MVDCIDRVLNPEPTYCENKNKIPKLFMGGSRKWESCPTHFPKCALGLSLSQACRGRGEICRYTAPPKERGEIL